MTRKIVLLLALPLYACGGGGTAPAPPPTPHDPRILLKCAGPITQTHAGPAHDRFARKIYSDESVYRIDLAHHLIEFWSEDDQAFSSVCAGRIAKCTVRLDTGTFRYDAWDTANDNGDALFMRETFVINRQSGSFVLKSGMDARRNRRLMSSDVTSWNGKCTATTMPEPITSSKHS